MTKVDKPLVWLHGEVKTPPFSSTARIEAGYLLRQLQRGAKLSLPHSRAMPSIGSRCHELRIQDQNKTWRVIYRLDDDAVVILEAYEKKTPKTPQEVIKNCKRRLRLYDS
ncbi:MAG: type II toxin-antitoxin system RelE/ParE family toxin [Bacteroidota bacterium]